MTYKILSNNKTFYTTSYTETAYTIPTLTENGTMGGNSFACDCLGTGTDTDNLYRIFDGDISDLSYVGQWFAWYYPNKAKLTVYQSTLYASGQTLQGKLQASNDNLTWVDLENFSTSSSIPSIRIDVLNPDFYSYYRIYFNETYYNGTIGDLTLTQTYLKPINKYYAFI